MAKKLLELLLTFGISLSLRRNPGTEFTAEVVQHLCKWLNVTIDDDSFDQPRAQGDVGRLGGGIHETFLNLAETGLSDGMNMCSQPSGYIGQHPIHACQAKPPRSSNYLVVTATPRWTLPRQAPTTRA